MEDRSIAETELAASVEPLRTAARDRSLDAKDRVEAALRLAAALSRLGRHDEAEGAARAAASESAEVYGAAHARHGRALEILADVLRGAGKHFEALPFANQAVLTLWNDGEGHLPEAIATRSTSAVFLGEDAFRHLRSLPDDVFARTVAAVVARADRDAPLLHVRVLLQ